MKNIFNPSHAKEVLDRIDRLSPSSKPKWGEMDVTKMLAHCSAFQDIAMGNASPKRSWSGILIGRFAKPIFYNDKPLARNMSTIPAIKIVDERNFEAEKEKLKQQIITFQKNGAQECMGRPHPFFGKLTSEQWGKDIYKHLDHHLIQFGV